MATKSVKVRSPNKASSPKNKTSLNKTPKKTSPKKSSPKKTSPRSKTMLQSIRKRGSPKGKSLKKVKVLDAVQRHLKPAVIRKMILHVAEEEDIQIRVATKDVYEPVCRAIERTIEIIFRRIQDANDTVTTFNEEVFHKAFPLFDKTDTPVVLSGIVINKYVKDHTNRLSDKKRPRVADGFRHLIRRLVYEKMKQYIHALLEITTNCHRRTVKGSDAMLLNSILDTWACV